MSVKIYVTNAIADNPARYAIDGGDLNLINDYFEVQEWQTLTREQHLAIANLIRGRISILKDNPFDMRCRFKPKEDPRQADIYSMIGNATIATYGAKSGDEVKTVLAYFGRHPDKTSKANSIIQKSIRGDIATGSIDLSKFIFRVCQDKMVTKYLHKDPLQRKE